MRQLSKFSPAETLMIIQSEGATIRELLKVTFMDLLLKQVVRTFDVERQSHERDPVRVYKYVGPGKNYSTYQSLPHESVFLIPFQRSFDTQILFRHVVKIGYQNSVSQDAYHRTLMTCPNVELYFSRSLVQKVFGGFSINKSGLVLRKELQAEMADLEEKLPDLIKNDPPKALDILKEIKGNIFLLLNIQFDLLRQIDRELMAEMETAERDSSGGGSYSGCWTFTDYSNTFDTSCSNDNGSGCSGCGSGCSSSGCGGCGGD